MTGHFTPYTKMAMDLSRVTRFHRHFNNVQKAVILGIISVFMAVVLGNVMVFTSFLISLVTTILLLKRAIRCRRHLQSQYILPVIDSIEAFYVAVYEFIYGHIPESIAAKKLIVSGDIESEIKYYRQYIMRDFIESWYQYISNENECRAEIRDFLEEVTLSAVERMSYIDVHDFADKAIRVGQKHLKDYQTAKHEWEMQPFYKRKSGIHKEFKKQKTLVHMFESQGKFHAALKDEKTCVLYIRAIMDVVMKILVPSKVYSCYAAKELLLEMLSNNLLGQIFSMLSDTQWLHETLIQITSDEKPVNLDKVVEPEASSSVNEMTETAHQICTEETVDSTDNDTNGAAARSTCLTSPDNEESDNCTGTMNKHPSCHSFVSHISVEDPPHHNNKARRATAPSLVLKGPPSSSASSASGDSQDKPGIDIHVDFENVSIGPSPSPRSATPPPGVGTEDQHHSHLHPNNDPQLLLRKNFSEGSISQNEACIMEEEEEMEGNSRPSSTFFFLPSEDEVSLASSDFSQEDIPDQRTVPDGREDVQEVGSPSDASQRRQSDSTQVSTPEVTLEQRRRVSDSCFNYQILPDKTRKISHFSTSVDEETIEVTLNGQQVSLAVSCHCPPARGR